MDSQVRFHAAMPAAPRRRLQALFRPILVFPHLLMVGGPVFGFMGLGAYRTGVLGGLAWLCAAFDWFAILLYNGQPLPGLQAYKRQYLANRTRVLAYAAFLRDEYPPFGEGAYSCSLDLPPDPEKRDKVLVGFRLLLALPHFLWLYALLLAWMVLALVAWLWLSLAGSMPAWIWRFSRDVMAYSLRVEAYALLIHDDFPAFSLGQ